MEAWGRVRRPGGASQYQESCTIRGTVEREKLRVTYGTSGNINNRVEKRRDDGGREVGAATYRNHGFWLAFRGRGDGEVDLGTVD